MSDADHAMAKSAEMISNSIVELLEAFDDLAFAGTVMSIVFTRLLLDLPDDLVEQGYKTHVEQCRRLRGVLERAKGGKH